MGFHITIDGASEKLIRKLKTSPSEIFDAIYDCYFLFLIGATDKNAISWLTENVSSLDSLSGNYFAFGIFLKEFKIPLQVGGKKSPEPTNSGQVNLDLLKNGRYSIERIIKRSLNRTIYDGDFITAVTYATDELARGFDVIDKLPCVILLDPIPFEKVNVINLSDEVCEKFFLLTRNTISKFRVLNNSGVEIKNYIKKIVNIQNKIEDFKGVEWKLDCQIKHIEEKIESNNHKVYTITDLDKFTEVSKKATIILENGDIKEFYNVLFHGSPKSTSLNFNPLLRSDFVRTNLRKKIENDAHNLRICLKTIETLKEYCNSTKWPIDDNWRSHVDYIFHKYVCAIIDFSEAEPEITFEGCQIMLQRLEVFKIAQIEKIISLIPSTEEISKSIKNDYTNRAKSISEKLNRQLINIVDVRSKHINNYSKNYLTLEEELQSEIATYKGIEYTPFSNVFIDEIKKLQLDQYIGKTKTAATKYGSTLLKPETIIKILDFFGQMSA